MFRQYITVTIMITCTFAVQAQDFNTFLDQVSENNPDIIAYHKLLEARQFEARSGLNPSDPTFTFGYMPGNIPAIGSKKIWSVNQSFSFPTKYLLQRKISRSEISLAEQEFNLGKLMILLEAKNAILDLIYAEKSHTILLQRRDGYVRLQKAWEKMLNLGETTILDYNKIRMELSSLNLQVTRKETDIIMLKNRLKYMSGSRSDLPKYTNYPITEEPDQDNLILEKISKHPAFILPEMEYLISREQFRLSKSGSLPEFQIGYSSEIIPGETYSGPVGGISIPLWSNANRVKTASVMADHSAAIRDAELARLESEVINEYSNMKALKNSILELTDISESGDTISYLDIALNSGEISLTTYFSDLTIIYEVEDRLIELEHEYYKSLASLLDYTLLK